MIDILINFGMDFGSKTLPKTDQTSPKSSEKIGKIRNFQECRNAFQRTEMHPIASEHIRTHPNRSKRVRKLSKTSENVKNCAKTSRKLRDRGANFSDVALELLPTQPPLAQPSSVARQKELAAPPYRYLNPSSD